MSEKLITIVNSIDSFAKARKGTGIAPVARVRCTVNNKKDTFWFTNKYVNLYGLDKIRNFGTFVPKNSDAAIKMQINDVGTYYEYEHKNNINRMQKYCVLLENRSDLQQQTIAIAGDKTIYQYRNISEFLQDLRKNEDKIKNKESQIADLTKRKEELISQKGTAAERGQITKTINELQRDRCILTQQQEDLKNITIYIRKQGEMRYSLIVDSIQTRIKTQNLFDGKTIIINGGPGTGKTTTMIHRLAYLTDIYAINEDENKNLGKYKLNVNQRKNLRKAIETQRDWMFFSPSKLLKDYLANAMMKEGLINTSQKVWNWKDYCKLILQTNYGILESNNNKAPFCVCKLTDNLFYNNTNIINEFTDFYLKQLREIKSQLPNINTGNKTYAWTSIANNIAKKFDNTENYGLLQFISLFNSLESVYGKDCKNLLRDNKVTISNLANEICSLLDKNINVKSDIEDIFELTSEEENEIYEEDDDDEKDSENNDTNNLTSKIKNLIKPLFNNRKTDNKLSTELQKWLKAYSYYRINPNKQLTNEQLLISEILLPMLGSEFDNKFQKIGELAIFEQYAQYTRGVKAIILNGIPTRYKKFRTYLFKTKNEDCNLSLLRDIMERKQGRELHHQEQSLILGFINNLVKQIKKSNNSNIKHTFIDAYDIVARPIIGIDEATDFSGCDIYAMQSLLTIDYSSLTLCGDMMQRMTSYGIKSWDDLIGIVSNPVVVEMKTSYRQSKRVLEVARQIYQDTLGETPSYKAYMKSGKVPAPLIYINEDEYSKIEWISKRISEVFRAYGEQLPSIAIFVNDKGYIPIFMVNLQNTDFFIKNEIKVMNGADGNNTTITDNHISVYPIDIVKGMEFDVVFFHNIDNSSEDIDMLKRYIYVGVSRAAFFLGVTLSEEKHEISKYFEKDMDWFKI